MGRDKMNETNELVEELKKEMEEGKGKVIFLAEEDTALGIHAAINQLVADQNQPLAAKAIGVSDISAKEAVLKEAKEPLILIFDSSDKREQELNKKIRDILETLKIKCIPYPLEWLQKKGFKKEIPNIVKMVNDDLGVIEKSLNDINAHKQTEKFLENIMNNANAPAIKTGFPKFDEALGGGLRAGRLYGIGAITSLGKTTFALQIADNMARAGQDVLIFSLEMSRYELMGKSVSRGTYKHCIENGKNTANATSLQSILDYEKQQSLSQENKKIIDEAIVDYRDNVADRINISEGIGNIGVKEVEDFVRNFRILKNSKPVVIIDYLQILAPYHERLTDKQSIDKNVLELKRICRDYQAPVIIINSFNRSNYLNEVSFEAFKESGAIEYSCDVLIGLQLCIKEREEWDAKTPQCKKNEEYNKAKIKTPREVEAIILKNRAHKAYDKIVFRYMSEYDYFEENPDPPQENNAKTTDNDNKKGRRKKQKDEDIQYDDEIKT
jgi:replicative DNA helicase